jgi:hypothetical protein
VEPRFLPLLEAAFRGGAENHLTFPKASAGLKGERGDTTIEIVIGQTSRFRKPNRVTCPRQDGLTGAKTIHASRATICFLGYSVMGCSANACYRAFVKQTKRVEVIDEIPILVHQAVLRFDFTGLGASEGEFANTNFSSNLGDVIAAADHLREQYKRRSC